MEAITTTGLADEIAFRLQSAILDGSYPPGTHLLQDELCERFGVSRTPVREALRKLQAQHLVALVPNKGATVRVPTREDLQEVYVVRAELEGLACELAAPHVGAETIQQLDDAQAIIERALAMISERGVSVEREASFNTQLTRGNEAFHGVIHDCAQNHRLKTLIIELQAFFPKDYVWRAQRSSDDIHALNVEEHIAIRDALEAGNAQGAREAMKSHILHSGSLLLPYLDEHGFWK